MDKRKPSKAVLAKKILLLGQKYKQQKKEERILMKRNKKLVNEIQSLKETSKSLNDERLTLQKDVYDKKYAKAVSESNNIMLKNSLSSFLNDLHGLQTKVINSWRENQRESLIGNRHSSKKPAERCPQESVEEQTLSDDVDSQSRGSSPLKEVSNSQDEEEQTLSDDVDSQNRGSSPLKEVSNSQDEILEYKIEALNGHEVKPVLTSHCDLPESKEELTLLLSSFCRRDTVQLDKPGPGCQESENVQLEKTYKPDFQVSENVSLERTCVPEYQEPENVLVEKTCKPDFQEPENVLLEITNELDFQEPEQVPPEITYKPDFQGSAIVLLERNCESDYHQSESVLFEETCEPDSLESPNLSLEVTCELDHQESADVPLEVTCEPDHQESGRAVSLEKAWDCQKPNNEVETTSTTEEPFHGFVEDSNKKAKFTEMIERLSKKHESLESLRNYELAQSLTFFESNPEVTTKEAVITSPLDVNLSKYYKIQQLEVSIPRLDLSAYPSLNNTIEIPKKSVSRRRKNMKSNQDEDRNKRDTTPDSASESSNNARSLRRARNAVSYKEKSLIMKLRRT